MEKMTIEEACEFLGVSRMTLTRRIKEGLITPLPKPRGLKIHRRLEFWREDVEKLVDGTVGTKPGAYKEMNQ